MTAPKEKPKQRDRVTPFVDAYLTNGGIATKAALAAGFSPNGASVAGTRMLRNAKVLALLEQRQAEMAQKHSVTLENVLKSLEQALHFDPRRLYNADGTLKAITELDDDTAMGLAGLEVVEKGVISEVDGAMTWRPHFTKKVKWTDKNAARDQAARILGAYGRDNAQAGEAAVRAAVTSIEPLAAKFREAMG